MHVKDEKKYVAVCWKNNKWFQNSDFFFFFFFLRLLFLRETSLKRCNPMHQLYIACPLLS